MADPYERRAVPVRSTASILAIVAAIASFIVDNAMLKFGLAIVGVLVGLVGFLKAASPRVRGGILSLFAIIVAMAGLLWSVIDALFL